MRRYITNLVLLIICLLGTLLWGQRPLYAAQPIEPGRCPAYLAPNARFGFNLDLSNEQSLDLYDYAALHARWYLDYDFRGASTEEMAYVRVIRTGQNLATLAADVGPVVDANPGDLWILGNEPDRDTQDGRTPDAYAEFYHEVYSFLKARDPSAQVAIGGVVQSTPLRRRYLDMVLSAYQARYGEPLPVDVFTVHGFVLREDQTWGAGIPPGLDAFAHEGMLYELEDHRNLEIFKTQMRDFRRWMADNGLRDKPLIVSEYGILMPADYGFAYEQVRDFMLGSFDFFNTETDAETGYPADANRLVQWWSWFSLNAPAYDFETQEGYNDNLFEPSSHQINALGVDFGQYVAEHAPAGTDLVLDSVQMQPPLLVASAAPMTVTVSATVHNLGALDAQNVRLRVWRNDGAGAFTLLATSASHSIVPAAAQNVTLHAEWPFAALSAGDNPLLLELDADNGGLENVCANQQMAYVLTVFEQELGKRLYLPVAVR